MYIIKYQTVLKGNCLFLYIYPSPCRWGSKIKNREGGQITDQKLLIDLLSEQIYNALDALDRGADNDWAREALEKANAILDDYYKTKRKDEIIVKGSNAVLRVPDTINDPARKLVTVYCDDGQTYEHKEIM